MNPTAIRQPYAIAHRGADGPENTLAAYKRAIELGVDAIEIDIHLSSDGVLVCIHDDTLDRTTDSTGNVRDRTLEEIGRVSAGLKPGTNEKQRIPLLSEVLELVRGKCFLAIEVKKPYLYPDIADKMVEELRRAELIDTTINGAPAVVVASFDQEFMRSLHERYPDLVLAQLTPPRTAFTEDFLSDLTAYAKGIAPYLEDVSSEMVDAAHERGFFVFPYTADTEAQMLALIKANVDGIITNDSETLVNLLTTGYI